MDHLAFEFEFWEARDAKARQLQWWLTKKAAQGSLCAHQPVPGCQYAQGGQGWVQHPRGLPLPG